MKLPAFFKSQKFYSLAASVLNAGLALVTFSLLARLLTKEEFGLWAFFLSIYGFFQMALNGLLRTPVIRMAANHATYNYEDVLASAWDILIKLSIVLGILVGIGFYITYLVSGEETYLNSSYWFLLLMLADIPGLIGGWNCNALMKFQRILLIRLVSASSFLLGVLYIFYFDGSLQTVFWFYLLSSATVGTLTLLKGWSGIENYFKAKKTYRMEILNFGKFSMGTTISSSMLGNSDAFLIIYFLGPEALALYEVPKRINGIYDIPLRSVLQLSYPHLAKKVGVSNRKQFRQEFERLAGFTFIFLFPLALLIFIFAEFLVTLLGGEGYAEASTILRVFALFLMISPFDRFSGVALDVLNRPKVNFTKVLIMLTVNVIGNVAAMKLGYGLTGVASATIMAALAGIIYGFYKHRKKLPFRPIHLIKEGVAQTKILIKSFL